MKAIVLAAGKGTRLLPLTANRPKHMLEVGGKAVLRWIMDELLNEREIDEVYVVVNYLAEAIEEAIDDWYGEKHSSRVKMVRQHDTLGTGDAVDTALQVIADEDEFMVINGDVVITDALSPFVQAFRESGMDGAILGAKVPDPQRFGILDVTEGQLKAIIEKPENTPEDAIINAGMYIFPPEAKGLFAKLQFSKRGEKELTDVINQLIASEKQIKVIASEERWMDIGHPWQLLEANEYLLKKYASTFKQLGSVEKGAMLIGDVHVAPTARIRSGVYIEGPVYIDEGADIGPNCYIRPSSYLGVGTRIGNACEIKNSIIYEGTHAAHLSYVGDSVLGQFANLGAGTITANLRHDGKGIKMTVKNKRTQTGRRKLGVIMGDKVKTGIGVSILPGVVIHTGTWVNANELVIRDKRKGI